MQECNNGDAISVYNQLYGKETLILEEITSTILSNEIKKRPNQEEQEGLVLMVTGWKGRGEGKKNLGWSKTCHFVTGKVIKRMSTSIDKSD